MNKNKKAQVFHVDVFGTRNEKYDFLNDNSIDSIDWNELETKEPNLFFVKKDFQAIEEYEKGFKIDNLFRLNSSGIKTHRDHFVIDFDKNELSTRIDEFYNSDTSDREIANNLKLKDNRDWKISHARKNGHFDSQKIRQIVLRPFDFRYCYYDGNLIDFDRINVMKHYLSCENYGFSLLRQSRNGEQGTYLINNRIIGKDAISILDTCTTFPLYRIEESERTPNLNQQIVNEIAEKIGLEFVAEKAESTDRSRPVRTFAPIDILDYIYAILHSPTYREKYKEFLKIDFPRVPYPKNPETFWQLVKLGGEIRQIHLLESPKVEDYITTYPKSGSNTITTKIAKKDWETIPSPSERPGEALGRIWINEEQYFDNIPLTAWEFYIGGYQPAQKWLKDRKERTLEFDDILHYQKIIVALTETDRLMQEIDKIEIE